MLVEKSMYNEAVERLKKYTENFEVGDPNKEGEHIGCLLYTSPSPRDPNRSRMPSSA